MVVVVLVLGKYIVKAIRDCGQVPYWTPTLEQLLKELNEVEEPARCPFEEAELWAPFEYVRGSKHLKMPDNLKAQLLLPR